MVLLSGMLIWVGTQLLGQAAAVPLGDESAHLRKALEMREALDRTEGLLATLQQLFLVGDAYPNVLYAWSQPALDTTPSMSGARSAQLWLSVVHVILALSVGRRLWGRPAALAYVLLACFSPIVLSYGTVFLLDVALASCVGGTVLLLEYSDGFRKPGASAGFAFLASISLLTKWTALVWLALPVAVAILRAVKAENEAWKLGGGKIIAVVLAGGGMVALAGGSHFVSSGVHGHAGSPLSLGVMGCGLILVIAWPWLTRWRRGGTPVSNALVALVSILFLAGPWYVLKWDGLLGRMRHEATTSTQVLGNSPEALGKYLEVSRLVVPAGELLLAAGLGIALWSQRGRLNGMGRVLGGLLAVGVTAVNLPFNARYLLPLAPLLAGACVGSWHGLKPRAQWIGFGGVALLLFGVTLGPGNSRGGRVIASDSTWSIQRLSVDFPQVPWGVPIPPSPLTEDQVQGLLDVVERLCGEGPCRSQYGPEMPGLQGRALSVLAMFRGISLDVQEISDHDPHEDSDLGSARLILGGGDHCKDPPTLVLEPVGGGRKLQVCLGDT